MSLLLITVSEDDHRYLVSLFETSTIEKKKDGEDPVVGQYSVFVCSDSMTSEIYSVYCIWSATDIVKEACEFARSNNIKSIFYATPGSTMGGEIEPNSIVASDRLRKIELSETGEEEDLTMTSRFHRVKYMNTGFKTLDGEHVPVFNEDTTAVRRTPDVEGYDKEQLLKKMHRLTVIADQPISFYILCQQLRVEFGMVVGVTRTERESESILASDVCDKLMKNVMQFVFQNIQSMLLSVWINS